MASGAGANVKTALNESENETTALGAGTPAPFALDAQERVVSINATPEKTKPTIVQHRLGKPTLEAMNIHAQTQVVETRALGPNVQKQTTAGSLPDVNLWLSCIKAVKGYRFTQEADPSVWQPITEDSAKSVLPSHKTQVINQISAYSATLVEDESEDAGFAAFGLPLRFRVTLGPETAPVAVFFWNAKANPGEAQSDFDKAKSDDRVVGSGKGAKRVQSLNYKAYVEFAISLTDSFEGVTVGGKGWQESQAKRGWRLDWTKALDAFLAMELVTAYQRVTGASALG